MDGIHDLGGMHGFGAVVTPGGDAPYHERWEPRVFALQVLIGYLVVPMRPAGTDGLTEDALAALVTRDCMIGTAVPLPPGPAA